jgi:hypothetical protein
VLGLEVHYALVQDVFTVRRSFAPWRTDAWIWVVMVACLCLGYLGVQFVLETVGERQLEIKQEQVKGNK